MATKTAKRANPGYRCSECGWTTVKWVGRCGECQAWGTVVETGADASSGRTPAATIAVPAVRIGDVDASQARFHTTGVSELDRVLEEARLDVVRFVMSRTSALPSRETASRTPAISIAGSPTSST